MRASVRTPSLLLIARVRPLFRDVTVPAVSLPSGPLGSFGNTGGAKRRRFVGKP